MHRRIAGTLTGRVTKWLVLAGWVIILVGSGPLAGKLSEVQDNQASSWLPGSAESTRADAALARFRSPDQIPTVVVYEKRSGLTPADLRAAREDTVRFQRLGQVKGRVVGPIPSPDHRAMQTVVVFDAGANGWNVMPDRVDRLRRIAHHPGLGVHVAGPGGQAADSAEAFSGLDSSLLLITVLVVVVILLLTYRSPVLWLPPVLSAGVALTVAQAVVYLAAKHADLTVNGQSQGILTVLVFGAGTDYALLLVARYREELRRHEDRHEAMAFALHRAAPAILASGTTVIVGMLCLLLADMNSTQGLGPVCAIGIAVGLLVMVTLLPALLVIFGRWMFWPARPTYASPEPTSTGLWARVGRGIAPRPRAVWLVTAGLLALACLGVVRLDAHGLSTEESYTKDFDSIVGQRVLTRHDMGDSSSPVLVVARAEAAPEVARAMRGVRGLGAPARPIIAGDTALVRASLRQDSTSPAAFETVQRVRARVHAVRGAHALVGGNTATLDDTERASTRDNRVILPVVLAAVLVILMLLLRAVLSPLLLIATVVLSFGAAMGLSALLFHYVLGFAGSDASLPLYVFVFLVALGIDYNIFLMTRVREETVQHGTRRGSLIALSATGGVITSAGLVLAATFSVLATMPLVAFVEIGVAVALGVLLDTMVVRSVLVTALNLDLGRRIWWPSSLDREPAAPEQTERQSV